MILTKAAKAKLVRSCDSSDLTEASQNMDWKSTGAVAVPLAHPDGRPLYWEPASFVAFSTAFAVAAPIAQANHPPLITSSSAVPSNSFLLAVIGLISLYVQPGIDHRSRF